MNKCKKCGTDLLSIEFHEDKCRRCEDKEFAIAMSVLAILAIVGFIGAKLLWAKFIYKDARCAFAQCRIEVDHK